MPSTNQNEQESSSCDDADKLQQHLKELKAHFGLTTLSQSFLVA